MAAVLVKFAFLCSVILQGNIVLIVCSNILDKCLVLK